MSGQLRALRNRIRSVENTKKITRAMEMVAAAKLRRFQDMMQRSRPFTEGLENLLKRVCGRGGAGLRPPRATTRVAPTFEHPFVEAREEKRVALVLITSDTGLCGSYNNDLINMGMQFIKERTVSSVPGTGSAPLLIGVGKSGMTALKNAGFPCKASFSDLRASRIEEILVELRRALEDIYLSKEVDAVYVVYSHFKTLTTYKAVTEKILPLENATSTPGGDTAETSHFDGRSPEKSRFSKNGISHPSGVRNDRETEDYIFEPSPESVFKKLIPFYFEAKIRTVFLEAIVSEQIARMTAMNMATKNAKEMIDSLVLKRNKARQAAITKEIIEIVSGSQALKLK